MQPVQVTDAYMLFFSLNHMDGLIEFMSLTGGVDI